MRGRTAVDVCLAAVAAGIDVTTKIYEFISYVECLTGDHNVSWSIPESHVLYLCFDLGWVQAVVPALSLNF